MHKLSPATLGNIQLENVYTKEATDSINVYIKALERKAFVQAASEKLIDIEKELLDLSSGKGADITFWQALRQQPAFLWKCCCCPGTKCQYSLFKYD